MSKKNPFQDEKTLDFITKAKRVHGDTYIYDYVIYLSSSTHVWIKCRIHGFFKVTPNNHLNGSICGFCARRKITTAMYKEEATKKHNGLYDYRFVKYTTGDALIPIICPVHGVTWQTASNHMIGNGCPLCFGTHKKSNEQYIEEANKVHNNKYTYPNIIYKDNKSVIEVICPVHGAFHVMALHHLQGRGCSDCIPPIKTTEDYIKEVSQIHNNYFSYPRLIYTKYNADVIITCPVHGDFPLKANSHRNGSGCALCNKEKRDKKRQQEQRNKKLLLWKELYNNLYDFKDFIYKDFHTEGVVYCKIHGKFKKSPASLDGGYGCPICGALRNTGSWNITLAERNKEEWLKVPIIIYAIRCYSNVESFFKIGYTENDLKTRFKGKHRIPYEFDVISTWESNKYIGGYIEQDIHNKIQEYSYNPEKKFGGHTECFIRIPDTRILSSYINNFKL